MTEKDKKQNQLLELIKKKVGKGKPLLEKIKGQRREPTEAELDSFVGKFIFDSSPEDLIKEIESSRTTGRRIESFN